LAAENDQHLRFLQFKFGASLSDEDLADILQEAHVDAIAALHGERPPTFPDWARAVAWFRRVCANTAIDAIRRRDGRRASERTTRPTLVSLDGLTETTREPDGALIIEDPLEALAAASLSEDLHHAIVEALRRLDDRDARLLQWRYADELEPEAIMRLEGLSRYKQYEGRHTRAVKALGRTVAGLMLHVSCRETRAIMRRRPDALLQPTDGGVQAHIETCLACRAFRLQLRGALAAIPLSPAALGAKLLLTHTQPAATTAAGPTSAAPASAAPWHAALAQPKLAAVVAAATLAVGAITTASAGDSDPGSRAAHTQPAAPSTARSHTFLSGESLGEHLTHNPLTRR
jgi:RNA polymerase sigma factor (sigma-70 family)